MSTHANMVRQTVSGTPGTGTITLSTASSGYRTLGSALGADATVDVLITDGTAWEVARDCAYTHSGTTLTRGTLESSSTGSAISLTSAAIVSVAATADSGRRWDSGALRTVSASVTTVNITGVVGVLHALDLSGLTANRTFELPAVAAVDDRIGIVVTSGDDAFELLITAASGDTLNGIAGGTEWSRLFITGETLVIRCVVANSTWVIERDGRLPQIGAMRLSTQCDGEGSLTFTRPTQASTPGAWTADINVGSVCSTSGDSIIVRRAGNYAISHVSLLKDAPADQALHGGALFHNGTTNILHAATLYASSASPQSSTGSLSAYQLAADDSVVFQYRSAAGNCGLSASALPRVITGFSVLELL